MQKFAVNISAKNTLSLAMASLIIFVASFLSFFFLMWNRANLRA